MKREPITLAAQAAAHRASAARTVARLNALALDSFTTDQRIAQAEEFRFYRDQIRKAETCEALMRLAAEHRARPPSG